MDARTPPGGAANVADRTKTRAFQDRATSVFKTANITLTIAFHVAFRPYSSLLVPTHIDPVAVHVAVQNREPPDRKPAGLKT